MSSNADGAIPTTWHDPSLWQQIADEHLVGQVVSGIVTCRRPFGVFVDIGFGTGACALLRVPDFADARIHRIEFDDFPLVGELVTARVVNIDFHRHTITLIQDPPLSKLPPAT